MVRLWAVAVGFSSGRDAIARQDVQRSRMLGAEFDNGFITIRPGCCDLAHLFTIVRYEAVFGLL